MTLNDQDYLSYAVFFATVAHKDHFRKHSGLPYITHCSRVMKLTNQCYSNPRVLAAAVLHDTVEDVGVTLTQIESEFGDECANYVDDVTKPVVKDPQATRKEKKLLQNSKVLLGKPESQTIKCYDRVDNVEDFFINGQHDFLRDVYLQEAKDLFVFVPKATKKSLKALEDMINFVESEI